jgi:hypothetical protein
MGFRKIKNTLPKITVKIDGTVPKLIYLPILALHPMPSRLQSHRCDLHVLSLSQPEEGPSVLLVGCQLSRHGEMFCWFVERTGLPVLFSTDCFSSCFSCLKQSSFTIIPFWTVLLHCIVFPWLEAQMHRVRGSSAHFLSSSSACLALTLFSLVP